MSLDKYGNHFLKGDCYRESCYQCPYSSIERVGDITIGDFWGILKSYPKFYSSKGVSSVFINTEKGMGIFKLMRQYTETLECTLEHGIIKQQNLLRPSIRPRSRSDFYKNIDCYRFIDKIHIGVQIKERIKSAIPNIIVNIVKRYFI